MDTLKGLLQKSRENSEVNFAVLFLDLKSFKTINDSLGHSMGDRLIKNVAKRLAALVREDDMTARFSGDKFGIILTDLLSREEATAFADRCMHAHGHALNILVQSRHASRFPRVVDGEPRRADDIGIDVAAHDLAVLHHDADLLARLGVCVPAEGA